LPVRVTRQEVGDGEDELGHAQRRDIRLGSFELAAVGESEFITLGVAVTVRRRVLAVVLNEKGDRFLGVVVTCDLGRVHLAGNEA
jgi:hypothetical protein